MRERIETNWLHYLSCLQSLMLSEHWTPVSRLKKEQKYKEQTKIHSVEILGNIHLKLT